MSKSNEYDPAFILNMDETPMYHMINKTIDFVGKKSIEAFQTRQITFYSCYNNHSFGKMLPIYILLGDSKKVPVIFLNRFIP